MEKKDVTWVVSSDLRCDKVLVTLSYSLTYPQVCSVVDALRRGGQPCYLFRVLTSRIRQVSMVPTPSNL